MTIQNLGIAALLAFGAAACSASDADDSNIAVDETVNAAEAANAEIEVLPPSEAGGNASLPASETGTPNGNGAGNSVSTPAPPPLARPANVIPAQYHGRWGMNANDCDPRRSDAKGLITINGGTMRFYESVATLREQRPAIATSFSGLFGFTGEGMNWSKVQTLTRTGDTLKRADDEGTYTYRRCA
jgi:hypothetical protein